MRERVEVAGILLSLAVMIREDRGGGGVFTRV